MAVAKKHAQAKARIEQNTAYGLEEALALVKEVSFAKFDETVEVAVRLGVDPRKADQMVRGAVVLPNGLGKTVRVLVFAKGEKALEAQNEGADFVGADDLVAKIQGGWYEFDTAIATPDMMGTVGKIGKLLGPRGLMPNPKVGTVTFDVARAVSEAKSGKVEYRVEKAGIIHAGIGKVSFGVDQLKGNIVALLDAIIKAKPQTSKGTYMKKVTLASTMGPSVNLDIPALQAQVK